ncbi:hypothetical protein [Microbispora sp. H13382]|uniref:hypothetical protein n=1 Tax=Microbispora sp. H13382 TaxID=2729112 RepID=UPI001C71D9D8|nr:hypothetical protein [Microbispora sp. H13382]
MRLFSTWGEIVDHAAEKLLTPTGWVRPDTATYPTGGDWAEQYLQPLVDALGVQAFAALQASPGARVYHDELRAREVGQYAALRRLANRLVGILYGCLKSGTRLRRSDRLVASCREARRLTFRLLGCLSAGRQGLAAGPGGR